jgi:uncharacterized protein
MKPRFLQKRLELLFKHFPMVALTGARQVGKSTLLQSLLGTGQPTVVFDPLQDIQSAKSDPDLFLQNTTTPAFLDEVQFAPELLPALKRFADRQPAKKGLFWLSGSQNLSVVKNLADSMAGRVAIVDLYALSHREMMELPEAGILESWIQENASTYPHDIVKPPQTNRMLWRGGMPGILEFPDSLLADYFQSYLRTYIERDIRALSGLQDLGRFSRFIRLLAALSAQEVNATQIGRDLDIDRTTALRWLDLAESTYQWKSIPAFSRNPIKRISGKQKGYFTDTGFLCALQGIFSPEVLSGHPLQGSVFETFVIMEILKKTECWLQRPILYHFRSYHGAEVDLILEYNGILYPLEIKLSTNPGKQDAMGFRSFRETFPQERIGPGLVVCCTPKAFPIHENVWAVPWWCL